MAASAAAAAAAASAARLLLNEVGRGLANLGKTCFMNAGLQCLSHLPPLLFFLKAHAEACSLDLTPTAAGAYPCFNCELHRLFSESLGGLGGVRALEPRSMANALCLLGPEGRFKLGRQEDAQEFLVHLLDALEISSLQRHARFNLPADAPPQGLESLRAAMDRMGYTSIAADAVAALRARAEGGGGGAGGGQQQQQQQQQ